MVEHVVKLQCFLTVDKWVMFMPGQMRNLCCLFAKIWGSVMYQRPQGGATGRKSSSVTSLAPLRQVYWGPRNPFLSSPKHMFIFIKYLSESVQFSSVAQLCLTLCDPMSCSTLGLPVHHQHPESTQTHAHRVSDAIQPSLRLSSPSPPAPNPSQHQGLFQWVNSSYEVAKVLEFQLQHQSFQWTSRTDLL